MDSSEKAWLTYALGRQAESSFLMIHVHFSHSTNRRDGSAKSETRFVGLRDGDHYSKASCLGLCSVSLKRMRERAECVVKIVCRVYRFSPSLGRPQEIDTPIDVLYRFC